MPLEGEYLVIDKETIRDPATLVRLLDFMLTREAATNRALSLVIALLLHHLGEMKAPPDGVYEHTLGLLRQFMDVNVEEQLAAKLASQIDDLLSAKE